MISVMIVAGSVSNKLQNYLSERGTFEVKYSYENLVDNVEELSNTIIQVDKLLYYTESNADCISDMKVLKRILSSNPLITIGEFIYLGLETNEGKRTRASFITVMKQLNLDNYSAELYSTSIGFIEVSNYLLGKSRYDTKSNKYNKVVRRDKNDEAKESYQKDNAPSLVIESYSDNNIDQYRYNVEVHSKLDSSLVIKDEEVKELIKINDLVIPKLELPKQRKDSKIIVCSGMDKTGKTMLLSATAIDCIRNNKDVCIIDYSTNSDVYRTLQVHGINSKLYTMKDILEQRLDQLESVRVIAPKNDLETESKMDFLQYIIGSSVAKNVELILLLVPLDLLEQTLSVISYNVLSVWICSTLVKEDVMCIYTRLSKLIKTYDTKVMFNDVVPVRKETVLSSESARNLINRDIKLVMPMDFSDLKEVKKPLYNLFIQNRLE